MIQATSLIQRAWRAASTLFSKALTRTSVARQEMDALNLRPLPKREPLVPRTQRLVLRPLPPLPPRPPLQRLQPLPPLQKLQPPPKLVPLHGKLTLNKRPPLPELKPMFPNIRQVAADPGSAFHFMLGLALADYKTQPVHLLLLYQSTAPLRGAPVDEKLDRTPEGIARAVAYFLSLEWKAEYDPAARRELQARNAARAAATASAAAASAVPTQAKTMPAPAAQPARSTPASAPVVAPAAAVEQKVVLPAAKPATIRKTVRTIITAREGSPLLRMVDDRTTTALGLQKALHIPDLPPARRMEGIELREPAPGTYDERPPYARRRLNAIRTIGRARKLHPRFRQPTL